MRHIFWTTAAISLFATAAFAQGTPAPQSPANSNNSATPAAAVSGLSRSQAMNKIQGLGYIDITGLKKGPDGVWHGLATKDDRSGPVSVDTEGNVGN